MSVNEAMLGFQFFYGILASDTTLASLAPGGINRYLAPIGSTSPWVIMALQSPGQDTTTNVGVYKLLASPLYQIKAVGPASITQQIEQAYERIDVLLGGKDGLKNQAITGGFIAACYRESPLQNDELDNGEQYTNIGGFYRLEIEVS